MIIITFFLSIITLLVVLIPFVMKPNKNQPRLESTYRQVYLTNLKVLEEKLENQEITPEEFQKQSTILARDVLATAEKTTDQTTQSYSLLFIVSALLILLSISGYYWGYVYNKDARSFDNIRFELQSDLDNWINDLTIQELEARTDISLITPQPPKSIESNYFYAFPALSFKSAQTNHRDIKALKLLALMYINIGDVRTNDLAFETYRRLNAINPDDLATNIMLLRFELANQNYQLTKRTEAIFESLILKHPDNESLYMLYAPLLYEAGKIEKSITQWEALSTIYKKDPALRDHYEAIQSIIEEVKAGTFQTSNFRILEVTIDKLPDVSLNNLPEGATLYLYLIEHDTKVPVAATYIPANSELTFPLTIPLSDFDRFDRKGKFIKEYDQLTIFARIIPSNDPSTKQSYFDTPLVELSKGAQKAQLVLRPSKSSQEAKEEKNAIHQASVSVTLTKTPEVDVTNLPDHAVLYLYIRQPGQHLPIAAIRVPKEQITFPLTISIGDEHRLTPSETSLFDLENLTLSARISLSGTPTASKGDIETETISLEKNSTNVQLTLQTIK